MPRPELVLLALRTAVDPARGGPEVERRRALEDDEDLLLLGVAVGDGTHLPRCELLPREAGELGAAEARPRLVALVLEVDLVDVADVLRTRLWIADLERWPGRLDVPGIVVASFDPRPPDTDRAGPREPADLGRVARAVHEVLEPVGPRDERVLVLVGPVNDAVARANLVDVAVLPGEPRAGEDVKDLFRGSV